MDKITDIQRKNGVTRIFLLSGETLRVPSALFLERRVRVNQEIDPEAYRRFVRQRGDAHALEAAMKFLALRERSEQEVRQRLLRACYEEETADKVIAALRNHHLLSDARFAEAWAHSRARKYGRARIAQELRGKGVSGDEVRSALEAIPEEEEYQQAVEQAKKLLRRLRNDQQKTALSLMRKGYSWSMARRAAEEAAHREE